MTPKEALNGLANFIIMHGNNDDYDASAIEWHDILKKSIIELERLKKFKETFDNYELAKKQDFIAYENWLECEKELEELKRDVKRFMELDYQAKVGDFLDNAEANEYTRLHRKLNKWRR